MFAGNRSSFIIPHIERRNSRTRNVALCDTLVGIIDTFTKSRQR